VEEVPMLKRCSWSKLAAAILVVSLQSLLMPTSAGELSPATLDGNVVSLEQQTPLIGATVHVADPRTGEIYSSSPTAADGSFKVGSLPASLYQLSIELDGGLYLVETPLRLKTGQQQTLNLGISPATVAEGHMPVAAAGVWSNPLTAALVVIGIAVGLGVLIDATRSDSDTPASPTIPTL